MHLAASLCASPAEYAVLRHAHRRPDAGEVGVERASSRALLAARAGGAHALNQPVGADAGAPRVVERAQHPACLIGAGDHAERLVIERDGVAAPAAEGGIDLARDARNVVFPSLRGYESGVQGTAVLNFQIQFFQLGERGGRVLAAEEGRTARDKLRCRALRDVEHGGVALGRELRCEHQREKLRAEDGGGLFLLEFQESAPRARLAVAHRGALQRGDVDALGSGLVQPAGRRARSLAAGCEYARKGRGALEHRPGRSEVALRAQPR